MVCSVAKSKALIISCVVILMTRLILFLPIVNSGLSVDFINEH